jgi:hypothetical protein
MRLRFGRHASVCYWGGAEKTRLGEIYVGKDTQIGLEKHECSGIPAGQGALHGAYTYEFVATLYLGEATLSSRVVHAQLIQFEL